MAAAKKGAVSQTFILTNTQNSQLQLLYDRFDAISKLKTSLERFGRDHSKQKAKITDEFLAKIDAYFKKAKKEIDDFLENLRESLLKELASKKEKDRENGLATIERVFSSVSFEEKLKRSKELREKYKGMKNKAKELIIVPNDRPGDDIPLLTKEKQQTLDELLTDVPSFLEKAYKVTPVTGIQIAEKPFSMERLFGFKKSYSFPKRTNLVDVSHPSIGNSRTFFSYY